MHCTPHLPQHTPPPPAPHPLQVQTLIIFTFQASHQLNSRADHEKLSLHLQSKHWACQPHNHTLVAVENLSQIFTKHLIKLAVSSSTLACTAEPSNTGLAKKERVSLQGEEFGNPSPLTPPPPPPTNSSSKLLDSWSKWLQVQFLTGAAE